MDTTINVFGLVGIIVGCLIVGAIAGFFAARYFLKKQLEKNPPVNENMIRAMYRQMGRNPSEAQIRQVMNSMNKSR